MIARRASGVMRDQSPISLIERKQPVHNRLSGWMTQILMQGLSTSARFQMSSVTRRSLYGPIGREALVG